LAGVDADSVTLCRDCLTRFEGKAGRCPRCSGPRLVSHPELLLLSIAHVDCDAFYATIEKRDNPALTDKPVIVGGSHRGVVAAACYVARTFGVHSAMPMFKALKACPHAVVIPPNMAKYASVGREVRELMLALTPAVEPLSIDEAFLDLSGTERAHGAPPAVVLAGFQRRVEREIGVTVSIGLSHTKFLAKIASDLDKPRGFAVIGRAETLSFLAAQPVSVIWGVGKAMQARLARDGMRKIADLQKQDERTLARRYGAIGIRLARLSRGEDERSVTPDRKAKSISAETTFDADYSEAGDLVPRLRRLSERVSARMKRQGLSGRLVVLKLKSADFRLRTRSVHLDRRTNLADRFFRAGRELLEKELDGTKYRLIGIGVGELGDADPGEGADLIDARAERRAKAEGAMDKIRSRYGEDGLALGLTFTAKPPRGRPSR
jgi:DNA polymerase-4